MLCYSVCVCVCMCVCVCLCSDGSDYCHRATNFDVVTNSLHLLFVEDIVAISHLACIPVIHLILAILMCMMMCADISYIISVQYVSWLVQL